MDQKVAAATPVSRIDSSNSSKVKVKVSRVRAVNARSSAVVAECVVQVVAAHLVVAQPAVAVVRLAAVVGLVADLAAEVLAAAVVLRAATT